MKQLGILLLVILAFSCKNQKSQLKVEQDKKNLIEISEIEVFLENQAKKDSLNGTVLIADGDNILLRKAYGFKDLNFSKRHLVEGKIGLASMPKMFTAIAIMQLESQGKIDINASVGSYLKDVENKFWQDITVRELLSHTSGLGFYWDYTDEDVTYTLDDLYKFIKEKDTLPKEQGIFNYSNNGYIILGKIVEDITSLTYMQYIEKNILNPLNMLDTEIGLSDGSYFKSTVDDIFKFSRGLRTHQLIKKEKFEEMISKQSEEDYGLGFKLMFKGQSKIYGHPGGSFEDNSPLGIASALDIIDERYTVIVLTNRNPRMGGSKARNFILDYIASNKLE